MKRDLITGITGLSAAVIFFILTVTGIRLIPNAVEPGPRMMPYIAELIIAICSVGLIIQGASDKSAEKPYFPEGGRKKIVFAYALLVGYGIALSILGFIISTPFAMAAFITTLKGDERTGKIVTAFLSIAVTAVLYLMFVKGFGIKLPQGILF